MIFIFHHQAMLCQNHVSDELQDWPEWVAHWESDQKSFNGDV